MANVGPFTQTTEAYRLTRYEEQFPLNATQYLRSDGGRYLTLDTSTGAYKLSVASSTQLDGWSYIAYTIGGTGNPSNSTPFISDATNGSTIVAGTSDIYNSQNGVWMPVKTGQTAANTNLDQLYDLAIEGSTTTTKQVVDLSATSTKVVKVLAVDLVNNIVLVCAVQKSA